MSNRSQAQTFALVFGVAFLAAGVLGFIPGVTTNLGDIEFAGNDSPSELVGLFQVSILHNIVHLLFGIAGIALSRTTANARMYVLFVYGLFVGRGDDANFVPINDWGDGLHGVLAAGLLGAWFLSRAEHESVGDRTTTTPTTR